MKFKTVVPKKISEARMARGLTMSELSKLTGISKQSISKYEMGERTPSFENLEKISNALSFSIEFFTFDDQVAGPESQGVTFFRSLSSATADLRFMVNIRNEWSYKLFTKLSDYINFPKVKLPNVDKYLSNDSLTETDIEDIARLTRKEWGLGNGAISNMALLLENKGLVVSMMKLDYINKDKRKIDASSMLINGRPFIFLENSNSAVRNRFNLAHELGHMIMHNNITKIDLEKDNNTLKQIEKEANRFASAFLLPEDSFPNEVLDLSLEHLLNLKLRWKVSLAAIIYRCEELHIFTANQVLYLRKQIASKKWRTNEPFDDTLEIEEPTLIPKGFNLLLDNNIIQNKDLSNFIGYIDTKEAYELTRLNIDCTNNNLNLQPNLKIIKGSL